MKVVQEHLDSPARRSDSVSGGDRHGLRHRFSVTGPLRHEVHGKRHPKTTVIETTRSGKMKWRPVEAYSASADQPPGACATTGHRVRLRA